LRLSTVKFLRRVQPVQHRGEYAVTNESETWQQHPMENRLTRPSIYITQPVAESAVERLRNVADVEVNPDASRVPDKKLVIAEIRKHDILFALLHDNIDRDVIAANPRLRAIATMAINPANVDLKEATARKIPVSAIAGAAVVETTADMTFALMLAAARNIPQADRFLRGGGFPGAQSSYFLGAAVFGKTLGLVGGRGRIGRAVAHRARGFNMHILYFGPNRMEQAEEERLQMTYMPLDQLLMESDFVSIHASMRPETHHLIGEREFSLMKKTGILINTSRGPIVDEAALARALATKRIASAGLDVFENEPQVHPELISLQNVVMVPHMGSAVREVREPMANEVVDNILAILDGKPPPGCVNPEIYSD
jgi:glyoxylate reductase